jgi:translation initiation factor IF-2
VAKIRVYELAKEFGVESKVVMDQLKETGEFVRSASSVVEPAVVQRLRVVFAATAALQDQRPGAGSATGTVRAGGAAASGDSSPPRSGDSPPLPEAYRVRSEVSRAR